MALRHARESATIRDMEPQPPAPLPDPPPPRIRWLQRLALSFIIIACILVWEVYKSLTGRAPPLPQWRLVLYLIGAATSFSVGVTGMRSRHRSSY